MFCGKNTLSTLTFSTFSNENSFTCNQSWRNLAAHLPELIYVIENFSIYSKSYRCNFWNFMSNMETPVKIANLQGPSSGRKDLEVLLCMSMTSIRCNIFWLDISDICMYDMSLTSKHNHQKNTAFYHTFCSVLYEEMAVNFSYSFSVIKCLGKTMYPFSIEFIYE